VLRKTPQRGLLRRRRGGRPDLVLAEIEFPTEDDADRSPIPATSVVEVTHDPRFTGGRLVRTGADELRSWLQELGVPFVAPPTSP
jgi:hypothetical protein